MPIAQAEKRFTPNEDLRNIGIAAPIFYFDANRGVTSASGSVSAWSDLSGNNFNMSQSTAGFRPTLVENADGFGNNCIRFDGTDDFLESTSVQPMNTMLSRNKWSYVAVLKVTADTTATQVIWSKYDTNGSNRGPMGRAQRLGANDYRADLYSDLAAGGASYLIYGNTNIYNTQSIVYGTYPGSAAGTLYVNGVSQSLTTSAGGTGIFGGCAENLVLGKLDILNVAQQFLSGDLYFCALYAGVLGTTQRNALFNQLAARFQISI